MSKAPSLGMVLLPSEQIQLREKVLVAMLDADARPTTIPINAAQLANWRDLEKGIQPISRPILYWPKNKAMVAQCLAIAARISDRWVPKKRRSESAAGPSRKDLKIALGSISSRYHEERDRALELEKEVARLTAELHAARRENP